MSTYATSARTREALIMAGGELFAQKGLDAVSTRAIAEQAGENIGSIHYHFKNKEGLLKAIMEFMMVRKEDPLDKCWDKYEAKLDDPHYRAEFIREFIDIHFDRIYFGGMPTWCGGMFYQCMTHPDDTIRKHFEALRRPHRDLLMETTRRLNPHLSETQAFVWANNLMGQMTHYAMLAPMIQMMGPSQISREDFLTESRRQIIRRTLADLGLLDEVDAVNKIEK